MKVSLSWLTQYVSVDLSETEISDALTMAGLEVDGVADRYAWLERVVAGRITSVRPHPNADRLRLCEVEAGDAGRVKVVCGAPNASENMVSALVLPGTELPDGTVIKKGKIRGEVSEGMLCSERELGLGDDASGIMALDAAIKPGQPLNQALSLYDPVFEIDLTPNRPDCLSIIGVAREVAAFSNTTIRRPAIEVAETGEDITTITSVTIEAPDLCPRYAARVLVDITVGPSPFWLRDRLLSVGLKPINAIVDITNFVMMETGQPLHAFDLDQLADNRIVVRCAGDTTSFVTLDDKERALSPDMLMICDAEKPVAVAGVMGGLNSEITETTTRVLLESACFHPASIRKTAKALGMSSDAAYRFERGVDPLGTVTAADRAIQLMAAVAGGHVAKGVIDNHPRPATEKTIAISAGATNRRLGTDLDAEAIAGYLKAVEFGPRVTDKETLEVDVPSFRVDVARPEDMMEEVARLWGYNNIPVTFPTVSADAGKPAPMFSWRQRAKDIMAGFGFAEVVNYSFVSQAAGDNGCVLEGKKSGRPIEILNPLTTEQVVMRTSLIPGLLLSMRYNLSQQEKDLTLFEVGRVFLSQPDQPAADLPLEPEMIAGLQTGARCPQSWMYDPQSVDFYDIKGVVEGLLMTLGRTPEFSTMPDEWCFDTTPGMTARILVQGKPIGRVGPVSGDVLAQFNLKQPAFVFEINFSELVAVLPDHREAAPISRFPAVTRDITVIADSDFEAGQLLHFLKTGADLIEDVQMVAVYEGEPVPPGKKSLSARVIYRSQEKTLKDAFVNKIHDDLAGKLLASFPVDLPK